MRIKTLLYELGRPRVLPDGCGERHGRPVRYHSYCDICDPLSGYIQIEKYAVELAKLQSYGDFVDDLTNDTLPAVWLHAFRSRPSPHIPRILLRNSIEKFLDTLIKRVQASKAWDSTAILITVDEGGGYYRLGLYPGPLDFFGDGTRIPLIVVSRFAKNGYIDHTYYDHASLLKFIEENWGLPKVSKLSRDNLPEAHGRTAPQSLCAVEPPGYRRFDEPVRLHRQRLTKFGSVHSEPRFRTRLFL